MATLSGIDVPELQETLKQRGLDGWLLFDFHGTNPIARRVIGYRGMVTRRLFVLLPAVGAPHAVVHSLDRGGLGTFPGAAEPYTTWEELHHRLASIVRGRRIAMEVSPDDEVPYVDRVPWGVVELLTRLGATIVSSAPLVTAFASRWSSAEFEEHRRAAEILANIARKILQRVVAQAGRATELAVRQDVVDAMTGEGLETEDLPIVAFGAHAADPHYEPSKETSATLEADQVVLLDLWGRSSPNAVWADQTWMGFSGAQPSSEIVGVWETVRDARDRVVDRLREATARHETVTGAQLDQTARQVISERGFGEWFVHRTGHSIDFDLHGSGPHLDDFETHDVRDVVPGVGFSVEPGVYLPGRFGVRSEINVFLTTDGPEVTPREMQLELIRPA